MLYSWIVGCDSSPHGTSWPQSERSIFVENDFNVARGQVHFSNLHTVWFKEVYEKWVKRHQKCINYAGEYFEME